MDVTPAALVMSPATEGDAEGGGDADQDGASGSDSDSEDNDEPPAPERGEEGEAQLAAPEAARGSAGQAVAPATAPQRVDLGVVGAVVLAEAFGAIQRAFLTEVFAVEVSRLACG